MTYVSSAVQGSPQEISEHFIKLVHARIAEVGGWRSVFEKIAAFDLAVTKAPGQVACPFTNAGKSKFRFRHKDLYTGCAIHNDFPINAFCDGIDVLAEYYQMSKTQTCKKILTDFFGMDLAAPMTRSDIESERKYHEIVKQHESLSAEEIATRLRKLEVMYHYTREISPDSPVAEYLRKRGLSRILSHLPADLGYNPRLYYWDKDAQSSLIYPGMVAILRDTRGRALTLHRTYVEKSGDKAPVETPKLMMKPPADLLGASIQLFDPHYAKGSKTWTLGVAEGIENTLSVTEATSTPCWAASSAWCLENVVIPDSLLPPPDVKTIQFYIWSDKDRANSQGLCAGREAANKLQARMTEFLTKRYPASELTVTVFEPDSEIPEGKKGIDWNDVLNLAGPDGFPVIWGPSKLAQL
ncbi:toprim domain-containing protein [Enterobacter asburiae]|nr:toprim domain-containing protein [Enterobacter asburiae]